MKAILKEKLHLLYDEIAKNYGLYLPTKEKGALNFKKYENGAEIDIDSLQTVKSAKDFFFPQTEDMVKFKTEGKSIEIIDSRENIEKFVIFGVRACDNKSFEILDKVFLVEPVDTMYKNRRDNAVIFTLACNNPHASCFCKVFGVDASSPKGDVECFDVNGYIYFNPLTDKGKEIINSLTVLEDKGESEIEAKKQEITKKIEELPFSNLDLSVFKGENLMELFDRKEWQELSEACLGCGTCTFVCPTCQCFDIRDFKTNSGVKRFRCWDSCMYSDFTQMAAENPRKNQMQRFRQRFMHKLCYYPSNNDGLYSCVGCGRCVKKCPQSLNIVKVIKKIGGKNND
ncbi:MAG: 4Fe-4S dicluster domain-containing protein [Clostridia bacterium]|nr:4Fe-4S dicluster domain-containing protein [Clostridia bacterium]